jgi:hypothetical protein
MESLNRHGSLDGLSYLRDFDRKPLKHDRESTIRQSQMYRHGLDSMIWAVYSRDTAYEDCSKVAEVDMPPSPLCCIVKTSGLFSAFWATKLSTNWVLDPELDLFVLHVEFNLGNGQRGCQSQNMLEELFVLPR